MHRKGKLRLHKNNTLEMSEPSRSRKSKVCTANFYRSDVTVRVSNFLMTLQLLTKPKAMTFERLNKPNGSNEYNALTHGGSQTNKIKGGPIMIPNTRHHRYSGFLEKHRFSYCSRNRSFEYLKAVLVLLTKQSFLCGETCNFCKPRENV